jgi:hypothetical protein
MSGAVEMRGEGVLASTWWFWKVCDGSGVRNAGMARVRSLEEVIYICIYVCMHACMYVCIMLGMHSKY